MKYICPNINCTNKECNHGEPHERTDLCSFSIVNNPIGNGFGDCPECIEIEEDIFLNESEMNL